MPAIKTSKPKTLTEHLAAQAPARPVNHSLGLDKYYRSADLLEAQANAYRSSGNEEQLYVMLLRLASLVIETIPQHKEFRSSDPKYTALKKQLSTKHISELEKLKLHLNLQQLHRTPVAESRNRPVDAVPLSASNLPQLNWGPGGAAPPPPPPPPQPELRVDDLLDFMAHPSGPTPPTAQASTTRDLPAGVGYGPSTPPYGGPTPSAPPLELAPLNLPTYSTSYLPASVTADRHALFARSGSSNNASASYAAQRPGGAGSSSYAAVHRPMQRYPSLEPHATGPISLLDVGQQQQAAVHDAANGIEALSLMPPVMHPSAGPSLGPQELPVQSLSAHAQAHAPDFCAPSAPPPPPPPLSDGLVPSSAAPAPGGPKELTKKAQLRDVHVSVALMEEFLAYAQANTRRGIESCGILAGRLLADDSVFAITTLIIPKQQGTSDTVQALNEEEIFDVQFQRELYPLGWIHTHPTQTCFLSSIDIHTQCGYQTMLDEAVAIVMAPTDPTKRCGLFRLTTPGGLSLIQRCEERGFHAHPPTTTGQDIYELCGHAYLNPRCKHEVIDLR